MVLIVLRARPFIPLLRGEGSGTLIYPQNGDANEDPMRNDVIGAICCVKSRLWLNSLPNFSTRYRSLLQLYIVVS